MKSHLDLRRILVAVLAGVLIGGGLMAVTPAGAEVAQSAATNWKKIWKKKLQPLADKRYYTKKQSDSTFARKTDLGNYWTKAESDAKYQPKGNYALNGSSYTKAESDARYAPYPSVIRGTFIEVENNATFASEDITFGVTLGALPNVNIIQPGGVVPANCAGGTVAAPNALPGNFCLFLRFNSADNLSANTATLASGAGTFGTILLATRGAAGYLEISGSWAVRPGPGGVATSVARGESGTGAPATSAR
jgi:hypothetical protein